ncbi:MAG: 1-acyl-sn-glycerol-3-phosphate acyltransferase [Luteolibacter sp.]|uniref:1-acyl-sn-glycerol-3-phosphate acyltransferase n=1 Tax=Luteolibacter sp. TaxID=1962973 RepID=UPI003263A661
MNARPIPTTALFSRAWYRCCHWLCARIYFDRITVLNPELLPADGPVLYVGLHRNGAVDGFIYHQVVPRGVFLISTQLRRSFFARLFFDGIAVARKTDERDAGKNEAALRECVDLLAGGGALVVFPEGTSSLGPRHLPFKSGAASMALDALAQGVPLTIIPLGIHYERAWVFRSKVEVVVGDSISSMFSDGLSDLGKLKEMKRRMNVALEAVGVNFPSAEDQEAACRLAYAATLGTRRSYFESLKVMENGVPELLSDRWTELSAEFASRPTLRHQGVPLFPGRAWGIYAFSLLVLGPLVLAGALVNFPPLLLGWLASRKLADDLNVIALWRILVGLPVFVIWCLAMTVGLGCVAGIGWSAGYIVLTIFAIQSLYRTKKVAVAVWNGLIHRSSIRHAWEFHRLLLEDLPPE